MTSLRVVIRPAATRDLDEEAEYLSRSSPQLAERFLEAAERTFRDIAGMPGLGTPCEVRNSRLQGLRCWPLHKFKKHLVFYLPLEDGIEVVRVLRGSRNLPPLLEAES